MEREKQKVKVIDTDFELTEEDIKHLLKSEEDIRLGRVRTMEESIKKLENKYGFKFYKY